MTSNTTSDQDVFWMQQALALAAGVMNTTTPNPRVGCVIVRDGQVLGQGATQPPGGPHAEIVALRAAAAAGHDVAGSTLYVTLEPCSHHGRTPPCVDAVLAARPARVVVAMSDPNPLVNGRGLARLREAGIATHTGVCLEQALEQNVGFVSRMSRGLPWLWLKLAGSLDGRSALHNGASQWITGAAARADGHRWRARGCVTLTGIGTVLADDPLLTPRSVATSRMPRRAILDTQLRTPVDAKILEGDEVWIFTASDDTDRAAALQERGARVIQTPRADASLDLPEVLRWLGAHDVNEVHVEAGAILNGALMRHGCVDELMVYLAPMLLGDAAPMVQLPALSQLPAARDFAFIETRAVGEDVFLRARRQDAWTSLLSAVRAIA